MEGFEDKDKMATDESIEFKREDHRQIVTDTSGESTANSKKRGDLELGNLISPVAEKVVEVVNLVIPKIQRVPWHHFFILSFFCAIPAAAYILIFTKMGFGLTTFYYLSQHYEHHSYKLGGSLAAFAFLLYLLDAYYWKSKFGKFCRMISVAIIVLGLALLVCFISATHPYGPISIYMVITPIWVVSVKKAFYRDLPMRTFVPWLSGPLFFNAIVILAYWITWTWWDPSNKWIPLNRLNDAEVSGCTPNLEKYPECRGNMENEVCFTIENNEWPVWTNDCTSDCQKVWDTCFNQFIVWVGPFLVVLGQLFLSFFASFLRTSGTVEQEAIKFAKIWFFLLFAMWISASLAGAGAGLSTTLAALTLSSFIASAIFIANSFSSIEREEQTQELWRKIVDNYGHHFDIAKGLLVVTCLPVAIVYFSVSILVESIRKMRRKCFEKKDTEERDSVASEESDIPGAHLLTSEARGLIVEMRSWNLAVVYTYAIYWGAGFITFAVLAAKFTTLFLSWLIQYTAGMNIGTVTGILVGVGVIMFLLPPVPGAPIYLTLGIVIVPVGKETFGIAGSIAYAMVISLALKLLATFLQQKMIGGLLKSNIGIRKAVGVNTDLIRAMKLCLGEKGLGIAKVSILCGGPDWPTSVLCGIMDLDLLPVLVGTLPVAGLVVPTVLAGSFTYMVGMQDDNDNPLYPWAGTAATMSTAAAAVVMFGCMLSAGYYLERVMSERADELKAMPYDEEVKKASDAAEIVNEAYLEVTKWSDVPIFVQLILLLSLACMITACYIVQLFQEDAFVEYQLTYNIDDNLDGDWKNLVKPLGFAAILLFSASLVFLMVFRSWAQRQAQALLRKRSEQAA